MAFVADASIALAWHFKDEATAETEVLRDRLPFEALYVPSHWALEVSNALLAARRRGRIDNEELRPLLVDLRMLPAEVDRHTDQMAWTTTIDIAEAHNLTTYDAAYLELATRKGVSLATLDKALAIAAQASGVSLLT